MVESQMADAAVKVLCFAGSLRKDSLNKKLVKIAMQDAVDAGAAVTFLDLKELDLPIYDGDLEEASGLPTGAKKLKELMQAHQAFLIASPEYNSSITGALKNAIDWASRPEGNEKPLICFNGKVAGIMAASPGGYGGIRGLPTLRSILENIGVFVVPDQLALAKAHEAFNEAGSLKDEKNRETLKRIATRVVTITQKIS
jgi:NAD(P)H-dependent FMN reductase